MIISQYISIALVISKCFRKGNEEKVFLSFNWQHVELVKPREAISHPLFALSCVIIIVASDSIVTAASLRQKHTGNTYFCNNWFTSRYLWDRIMTSFPLPDRQTKPFEYTSGKILSIRWRCLLKRSIPRKQLTRLSVNSNQLSVNKIALTSCPYLKES